MGSQVLIGLGTYGWPGNPLNRRREISVKVFIRRMGGNAENRYLLKKTMVPQEAIYVYCYATVYRLESIKR